MTTSSENQYPLSSLLKHTECNFKGVLCDKIRQYYQYTDIIIRLQAKSGSDKEAAINCNYVKRQQKMLAVEIYLIVWNQGLLDKPLAIDDTQYIVGSSFSTDSDVKITKQEFINLNIN